MQALDHSQDAIYAPNLDAQLPAIQLNDHEIPIDPLLGGPVIVPVASEQGKKLESPEPSSIPELLEPPEDYSQPLRQYSQGPQGDPFAPPPPPYMPIAIEQSPPPKAGMNKKKRKTRKPDHCGTCDGNDAKNKYKQPEGMVSCIECGRKDHPSCISAEVVGDVVRSYEWRCSDCKICEVCLSKGDEAKMVFCDHCDRGWHQDCLNPPLEETPKGKWHCPKCPPLEFEMPIPMDGSDSDIMPAEQTAEIEESVRASSLASSSQRRSNAPVPIFSDDSDSEVLETPSRTTKSPSKRPAKRAYKKRGRPVKESPLVSDEETTPIRQPRGKRQRAQSPERPLPRVRLRLPNSQKGKGKEREPPESPKGMFDEILGVDERDTTRTSIIAWDKQQFDRSRQLAEDKIIPPAPPTADVPSTPIAGPSRPLRSTSLHHIHIAIPSPSFNPASPSPSTPGAKVPAFRPMNPDTLRIRTIRFGQFDIKTWYDAPFPEEYASIPDGRLWICEFCLKYMKSRLTAGRHKLKCKARHPPGDEIYRDGAISIFEVDGRKNKIYCQNLCLLSKMFLDHKSLFYDVEPFLFYVITETDEFGARFVGYFSKEKRCSKDYNLSCIMTLPVRQRQGWGNLLIDFSYLLSKKEKRAGSPEKPLSALGAIGYRNYWTLAVMRFLETAPDDLTLQDISQGTAMTLEDIHSTLVQQNMITVRETTPPSARPSPGQSIKYPKGRRGGVSRRALQRTQTQDDEISKVPFVPPDSYRIHWDRDKVSLYLSNWRGKGYLQLKPERLKWTPFLISRAEKQLLESEADEVTPLHVVATQTPSDTPRGDASSGQARSPSSIGQTAAGVEDSLPIPSPSSAPKDRSLSIDTAHLRSSSSPSPVPTPPRRRTRSQNIPSSANRRSASTTDSRLRPSRSTSRIVFSPPLNDTLADDEALAAQLQDEEQHPKRRLRSRQGSSQHVQRSNSTTTLKRKRIESSPEEDEEDATQPTSLLTSPPQPNGRHGYSVDTNQRHQSVLPAATPLFSADRDLDPSVPTQVNGHQSVTCTASEYAIATLLVSMNHSTPSPSSYVNGTHIKSEDTSPSSSVPNEQSPSIHVEHAFHYPNGSHINGSNDLSTNPLMLHPDHITLKSSQVPDTEFAMAIDDFNFSNPEQPLLPLVKPHDGPHPPLDTVTADLPDEYGDEDADGEYEEDAEGEPDDELFGTMDSTDVM